MGIRVVGKHIARGGRQVRPRGAHRGHLMRVAGRHVVLRLHHGGAVPIVTIHYVVRIQYRVLGTVRM